MSGEGAGKLRASIRANAEDSELGLRHDSECSPRGKGRLPVGDAISVDCEEQIGLQGKMEEVLREDRPEGRLAEAS